MFHHSKVKLFPFKKPNKHRIFFCLILADEVEKTINRI